MTLGARLFAAIGAVAVLSVAVAFTIGAVLTRKAVERNTLRDLSAQADLLTQRERAALLPFSKLRELEPFLTRQHQRVLAEPVDGSSRWFPSERAPELRRGVPLNGTIEVDGERYFYAARLLAGQAFVLLKPTTVTTSSWRPHLEGLVVGALAAGLLAAAAAFLLARAIARPVRRVADATRSLAAEETHEPVPVEGARELRSLAESFNEMADQLDRARDAERSFLLSVSHELKTPLTAIRGYAEGVEEGVVTAAEAGETIRVEALRLERLVQDLLDLGRMNKAEFSVERTEVDLALTVRDVVRRYEAQARAFGVGLEAVCADDALAVGDADRLLQVASNLVENALRLTPAGGTVRVRAAPGELVVEDTGPGLGPEELERAFERFYLYSRYGRERQVGTGLGLAIVKQLAEGMGGSVRVTSDPGRLTRFAVSLPRPRREAPVRPLAPA
ncbi:MAG TPA: HAMP domain-containing sensor histidine kinase [Gaiellaceae bacterium]|nr:HAMP domain-containing sensor histidine kinase [Gaiellaceae bacterium]